MEFLPRVQGIILRPKDEWEKIKSEPTTFQDLFKSYVLVLAAIPAVAQFLGYWLIGIPVPFKGLIRFSFASSLGKAAVFYVFSVLTIFVMSLIIDALAPTFSSRPNQINALKLVAYGMTPYFVFGVFYLFPILSVIVFLGGLYGLYVLYLGFQSGLMETPPEKVMFYFVVTILIEIVIWLVVSLIVGAIFSLSALYRGV